MITENSPVNLRRLVPALLILLTASISETNAAEATKLPNIVVVLADDLGYGDVQCYNRERGKIATPSIDKLAGQGMRFTDGHSSSGVCSPSRYTLLTGRYHWRTRLQRGIVGLWGAPLIAPDRLTIGKMLQQRGYQTACIGKWHLGWNWPIGSGQRKLLDRNGKQAAPSDAQRNAWRQIFSQPIAGGPITRGFDRYFGTDVPNWPPYCFIENDRTVGIPSEFLDTKLLRNNQASKQGPALKDWTLEPILPALGDQAAKYIREASSDDRPYFLYLPLTAPHTPLAVDDAWKGKSGLGQYADFVMETDAVVGQVVRAVDESGEADNTLILFTSDNGCAPYIGVGQLEQHGHFPSGPLRGYKSDVWEGGHRVPFIVRMPGLVQAGSQCDQLVQQADILATCAELTGFELPDNGAEDSVSFLPLLRGSHTPVRETAINQSISGRLALRMGAWKMIFGKGSGGWTKGSDDQPAQLYRLDDDLAEQKNLFAAHPDVASELITLMRGQVESGRSTPGTAQKNDVPVQITYPTPAKRAPIQ
ncbi:MAG: arylsulfatase [Planctomycetales bacterium]|nr:arylsulfatase [Planctomycetales bacterium]